MSDLLLVDFAKLLLHFEFFWQIFEGLCSSGTLSRLHIYQRSTTRGSQAECPFPAVDMDISLPRTPLILSHSHMCCQFDSPAAWPVSPESLWCRGAETVYDMSWSCENFPGKQMSHLLQTLFFWGFWSCAWLFELTHLMMRAAELCTRTTSILTRICPGWGQWL